jgi:DNA invertase Pin-like site-specific DNA recombinase
LTCENSLARWWRSCPDGRQEDEAAAGGEINTNLATRSRRLRDRSPEDLQTMIDLYKSGTTAKHVAERFGVSLRSIKRLLQQRGVRREGRAAHM